MLDVKEYLRAFRKTKSLAELIPGETFIGDNCLLNKSGSVVAGFCLNGRDSECMDGSALERARKRLITANALFGVNYRSHQYLIRTRNAHIPGAAWNGERIQFLRENAQCGSVELFQSIEALLPLSAKLRAKLDPSQREKQTVKMLRDLAVTARAYTLQMRELADPQVLHKAAVFNLMRRIVNLGSHWAEGISLRSDFRVAEQLQNVNVYWDRQRDSLRIGRRFVRVFTLRDFPDYTIPNLWSDLLSLDVDFLAHSSWQALDRVAVSAEVKAMRQVAYNIEHTSAATEKRAAKDANVRQIMENGAADDKISQFNRVLRSQGGTGGSYTGLYGLTVVVHSDSPDDLQSQCEQLENVFKIHQAPLVEESGAPVFGVALPVYFSMLPGNKALALREMKLQNHHYADLSFVWTSEQGARAEDYANVYETRANSLFYSETHYGQVAAECITGMTRSGKTVYMLDRINALLAKNPFTVIFDVGESYSTLVSLRGGSIVRFSASDIKHKIWPFRNDLTPDYLEFLKSFLRLLIESHGYRMRVDDDRNDMRQLEARIEGLYYLDPNERTLTSLADSLQGDMKAELRRWCAGGQYGGFFDHNEDTLRIADLQLFEFERVRANEKPPAYFDPLMMILTYRVDEFVTDAANLRRLKHIVMDEAGIQLKRETAAAFMLSAFKSWQKKNCMISAIAQSPSEYGALRPFILESCSSFVFFPNPHVSPKVLTDDFGFDDAKVEVFQSLRAQEFLYHAMRNSRTGDIWKICKLSLDAERQWMFTTSPEDQMARNEYAAEYGLPDAIKKLAATAS